MKMSKLLAALLFAFSASAFAADSTDSTSSNSGAPTKPITGQGAATTVGSTPASDKSGGHADKGLTTAQDHINADHGKPDTATKPEKAAKPERPARPERAGR